MHIFCFYYIFEKNQINSRRIIECDCLSSSLSYGIGLDGWAA